MLNFLSNKKENDDLRKKINDLQRKLSALEEKFEVSKFYSEIILELNSGNNDSLLTVLGKLKDFIDNKKYKDFNESDELKNCTDKIRNYYKGKEGEILLKRAFDKYKKNKQLEYFYDLNIKFKEKSKQFDFLVITHNNIYNIEVKNLSPEKVILEKDNNQEYILRCDYKKDTHNMSLNDIKERYNLIKNILEDNDCDVKHKFNILAFPNEIPIENTISTKSEIKWNEIENFIQDDDGEKLNLQILNGKNEIKKYFDGFLSNKHNIKEDEKNKLHNIANAIKNDINFVESTDKIYISRDIMKFFDELFKTLN